MKGILLMILALVGLSLPVSADDVGGTLKKQVMRGLVNAAQRKLEAHRQQKEAGKPAAQQAPLPQEQETGSSLNAKLKDVIKGQMEKVKEHYKDEGREYARELGELLAERIVASPRVRRTMTILEVVAGVLALYLTLVALKILSGLRAIRRENARILKLLGERKGAK